MAGLNSLAKLVRVLDISRIRSGVVSVMQESMSRSVLTLISLISGLSCRWEVSDSLGTPIPCQKYLCNTFSQVLSRPKWQPPSAASWTELTICCCLVVSSIHCRLRSSFPRLVIQNATIQTHSTRKPSDYSLSAFIRAVGITGLIRAREGFLVSDSPNRRLSKRHTDFPGYCAGFGLNPRKDIEYGSPGPSDRVCAYGGVDR
jgi:hypothetical protein